MTSKFHNQWHNDKGKTISSESRPGEYWYPVINPRRVSGSKYQPYQGNSEWVRAANKLLASHARSNFETR